MKRALKVAGVIAAAVVILVIGITIGSGGKTATAAKTITKTVTRTVPGPTVTKTVTAKPAAPATAGPTMPGDGTFAVGTAAGDWAPGTWQTAGAVGGSSGDCYWATLSDLTGNDGSILANDNTTGPAVVTVGSGVAGVQVSGCDAWHLEG